MPKFRDVIVTAYNYKFLDDIEFAVLYDINKPKNPNIPYWSFDIFDLDELSDDECQTNFRFYRNDIFNLAEFLQLPEVFKCYSGVIVDKVEAFCMFLKRFSYPCRYADMVPLFARPIPQLCMTTNKVMNFIHQRWNHLLLDLNQPWLSQANLELFSDAIRDKGAALNNCWGFVDGTVRPVSRPGQHQRVLYNGHKKVHSIKFQSVVAPNGLIANLYGPVEGRRHDSSMLMMSGLLAQLQ